MDLFESSKDSGQQPLAYRMRPRTLDEYAGQDHIVGEGRLLRRMIQADQLSSLIFYGPPGTGKTTLARVIAHTTKSIFTTVNAVLSGVKTLREEIEKAKERSVLHQKRTILFVDEIHRWNKAQQDALLPWVENGTIILIGATTENPYFEVNSALVSRSRIFQLKTLSKTDLMKIARAALTDPVRGYGRFSLSFEAGALEHLVDIANGDARSLLNAIQLAVETTPGRFPPPAGEQITISLETAEESIQKKVVLYDKEGDYHFDIISAFIKSIRGSDPDASLYWLAKMVRAGEDPRFIFRRMLISASEDIGLADPAALGIVTAAAAAFDRVGMPEGRFHLTQAALYLSTAPKSNSSLGFFDALKAVEAEESGEIPNHLKDGGRDKEGFGHGKGYLYPHAYHDHWVAQQYLPDTLKGEVFYHPGNLGYEGSVKTEVLEKRELNMEASAPLFPEILTTAPRNSAKERWLQKLAEQRNAILSSIKEDIFKKALLSPHHRVLVLTAGSGFLLWEACRQTPEGIVYALPVGKPFPEHEYDTLRGYADGFDPVERPRIINTPLNQYSFPETITFECIIGRNTLTRCDIPRVKHLENIKKNLNPEGLAVLSEIIPAHAPRLSSFVHREQFSAEDYEILIHAEDRIYGSKDNPVTGWDEHTLTLEIKEAGFTKVSMDTRVYTETRTIRTEDIKRWFNPAKAPYGYGKAMMQLVDKETLQRITHTVLTELGGAEVKWESSVCTLTAQ